MLRFLFLACAGVLPLQGLAGGFVPLDLPGSQLVALSRDGCVAAGTVPGTPGTGFRWRSGAGVTVLPGAITVGGLSASGDYTAGSVLDEMQRQVAAYWDAGGTLHRIGPMPGIETIGTVSQANAVSDEPRVVGSARRPDRGSVAFQWTRDGGMRALPGADTAATRALAISGDGRRIAGAERSGDTNRLLLWHNGALLPHAEAPLGELLGASHDVRMLLGLAGERLSAAVWRDDGVVVLPLPEPGDSAVRLLASSDDGRVRVGARGQGGQRTPVLWLEDAGYVALGTLLQQHGITLPADWSPVALTAVSGDGRRLGGWGKRADDRLDSFLIDLGPAPDCALRAAVAGTP